MKQNIVGIFIIFLAASCSTERLICPAYQSAFIHDKATLDKKFSYFGEDSLPKILEASKGKHLLIDPVTYRKKLRSLQTVAMTDVYPQKPDSLEFNDEFSEAEMDPTLDAIPDSTMMASTASDSVYVISLKKEKFNIDQELYLWYLRKFLVYPDVKLQMEENIGEAQSESKEKVGFFKRLFGGKKKDKTNFDVETSATELDDDSGEKKKFSLFGKKNKKNKDKETDDSEDSIVEPVTDPAQEEEEDGDEDF